MGLDVTLEVLFFFINKKIEEPLNANMIILILNVKGTDNISHFRPISLAYFIFKIITKVLKDRWVY